jgi:hypothetical protein
MDWGAKGDLFEQLRREHEFRMGTIAGVAVKFGASSVGAPRDCQCAAAET